MSDFDDIDLAGLSDEDLVAQMHDDLYDGLKEEVEVAHDSSVEAILVLLEDRDEAVIDLSGLLVFLGLGGEPCKEFSNCEEGETPPR